MPLWSDHQWTNFFCGFPYSLPSFCIIFKYYLFSGTNVLRELQLLSGGLPPQQEAESRQTQEEQCRYVFVVVLVLVAVLVYYVSNAGNENENAEFIEISKAFFVYA